MTDAEYLKARYGAQRSDQKLTWVAGGILTVIVIAWFVWQAFLLARPSLEWEEAAFNIVSDSQIEVTFNVAAQVGDTITCTVRAYTENTTEVGVKDVTVGPLAQPEVSVTESVATIQPATGVRVTDCRFVTD